MPGSQRRTIQGQRTPTLEDPIDDRVREVLVVEHAAPGREGFVRREDHGPLLPAPIIDDVEEHVRSVSPVREVADFVDHDHGRVDVASQGVGELAAPKRAREIINQFGSRDKQRITAVLDRTIGDRNGQVRFPTARFSAKDQASALRHEVRRERGAQEREADGGLIREIEIINCLEKRKVGPPHHAGDACLLPVRDFFRDQVRIPRIVITPSTPS